MSAAYYYRKNFEKGGRNVWVIFKEDHTCKVIRNPSSLGCPSIGDYTIYETTVSGEADTNVNFAAQKFGEKMSGKWVYTVNGVSAVFMLKN